MIIKHATLLFFVYSTMACPWVLLVHHYINMDILLDICLMKTVKDFELTHGHSVVSIERAMFDQGQVLT